MADSLCVIVMAAGLGSRFRAQAGTDKLLARYETGVGESTCVLQQTLRNLKGIGQRRVVVTRPDNGEVAALARREGFDVLAVQTQGMGETLAQAIAAEPNHRGWLIALGDMPFVQPETFCQIAEAVSEDVIAVPFCSLKNSVSQASSNSPDGTLVAGNPVAFGRRYFKALCALTGDRGGRGLFGQGELRWVECSDPGIYRDVDVPDDLKRT
ncbi:nucleotidyltransferase family protein [Pseudomonas luteola]|uniref:nucleotidyltransferase family protein n=1 Tax=Pseudomonas luteola TaxID=47886 RepID=UPI000F7900CE|nr:nucleotidyltransferase family protein [Pseudomonas luteola]RRW42673.1 nucleotidyltransferase family protein [Pseudomonas luteola]